MNLVIRSRRLAVLAGTLALFAAAQPAAAQDIAEPHAAAARQAIAALDATGEFDSILPQAAQALKTELIQKNPDLQADIIEIVDQVAFALAARRGDLEHEAALAYARIFSQEELTQVAAFYESTAGQKLLTEGPKVMSEVFRAAEIWQNGIARDLAQQVAEELSKRHPAAEADGAAVQPAAPAGE